jgi:hypothetical protein
MRASNAINTDLGGAAHPPSSYDERYVSGEVCSIINPVRLPTCLSGARCCIKVFFRELAHSLSRGFTRLPFWLFDCQRARAGPKGSAYRKEVTINAEVPESGSMFVLGVYLGNMRKLREEKGGTVCTH